MIRDKGETSNWGTATSMSECMWYSNYTKSPDNLECVLRYCTNPGIKVFYFFLFLIMFAGTILLSVAEASSVLTGRPPENVLKDDDSIWHSINTDPKPFISLKMDKEEEVSVVKVVDRLGCAACSGRYTNVEVRVAMTPAYDGAVSCGIKSGDGIVKTVHE